MMSYTLAENFGPTFRKLRQQAGLSQEDCGDKSFISRVENGTRGTTFHGLQDISEFFGLTLTQLMFIVENLAPDGDLEEFMRVNRKMFDRRPAANLGAVTGGSRGSRCKR